MIGFHTSRVTGWEDRPRSDL